MPLMGFDIAVTRFLERNEVSVKMAEVECLVRPDYPSSALEIIAKQEACAIDADEFSKSLSSLQFLRPNEGIPNIRLIRQVANAILAARFGATHK